MPSSDDAIRARYRWRIIALLAFAPVAVAALGAAGWTVGALGQVDAVEAERDRWQRPDEVLDALDVHEGSVVADLGSGVGYFALRLADRVGPRGRVVAVDLRPWALRFLRVRALVRGRAGIVTVVGDPDDPHLPPAGVDAVLVANTYHELTDPEAILARIAHALRPGGRLVLLDPSPAAGPPGEREPHRHVSAEAAEARLRAVGFEILGRDESFVPHGSDRWWLIVARRPAVLTES